MYKIILLILLFISMLDCLLDSVTDKRHWNEDGLLNIVTFGSEATEALRVIVPQKTSFKEKKRAFFEFCKKYGTENRTAIVGLSNKLIYVYNGIPDNFKNLGHSVLENFEQETYTFDEETLQVISNRFDEEYARGNLMQMWNSKQAFDKHLKYFQQLFYSPLDRKLIENASGIDAKVASIIIYILGEPSLMKDEL